MKIGIPLPPLLKGVRRIFIYFQSNDIERDGIGIIGKSYPFLSLESRVGEAKHNPPASIWPAPLTLHLKREYAYAQGDKVANLPNILQQSFIDEAIGGLIVVIVIWLLTRPEKRWSRLKAIYEIPRKLSSSLAPTDLLGERAHTYNPYYFTRPEDKRIRECIARGEHCCVVGQPLAGKTRAVFEALNNIYPLLTVTKPHLINISNDNFDMPFPLKWWEQIKPSAH